MRILAFDHFYGQDLGALAARLAPGERLDAVPYQRLHRLARRSFPAAAFTGLAPAYEPSMEASWRQYRPAARAFTDWLALAYRPSVFVVPSDAFFYLRPLIERLRELTVPTVVVQKETSISPMIMEEHSRAVGRDVPFVSDLMTVCSERHKEFWVRAGTPPERVVVTGQPRFDVYAAERAGRVQQEPPVLLYLSYDDITYLPSDTGVPFEGTWRDLRRATEEVLAELARDRRWRVVAKPHPQQRRADDWLGDAVTRAARDVDTRPLVIEADAIVAFQTTVVYEAVVADRPVVYAAWGPLFDEVRPLLLPFHEQPALCTHARSPGELRDVLAAGPHGLARPGPEAVALAEEQLGPVDGKAAERVLQLLRGIAVDGPTPPSRPNRRVAGAAARGAASPVVAAGAALLAAAGRGELADAARRRARHWRQEAREAIAVFRSPAR